MSSAVILAVLFFHGAWGTFPPVSNPPPIPSQAVRNLDISQVGQYIISEDLSQAPPQSFVKSEGSFPPDTKPDEQRWYLQENQPGETVEVPSSGEEFDRYYGEYTDGQPAIGPVATPIPDDAFIAQSSSISKVNPNDLTNVRSSDFWIVTRGSDNQYISERWLPIPVSTQQVVEVSQDPNPPVATDTVKSIAAPVPLPPDASLKTQLAAGPPANIVQQIWVPAPTVSGSQKVITDTRSIVSNAPSLQQIVNIPATSIKQVVQQQVTKDAIPVPPPALAPVVTKTAFTVPPPPPPPIKGGDTIPTVLTSVPAPDSNVLLSGKNGAVQQVRHIWVPTSARTGRFITVPVSNVNAGKSVIDKGIPLNPTPIAMSDTWVLTQDGSVPSFEQQKSVIPPPVVQGGKVVVQNPPVVQIDSSANPPLIAQSKVPPNLSVVGKSVGAPADIWPTRKDGTVSKVLDKSSIIPSPDISMPPPNTGSVVVSKSFAVPPVAPVVLSKSIVANSKLVPPPPAPVFPVPNGKPCPLPLPKTSLNPPSQNLFPVSRVLVTRRQPLTRIVRVNRYPSGTYYLLNNGVRPNFYTYPSPAIVQPKNGFIRLIQTKQFPIPVQSKQAVAPVQTKQISVPVQSKSIPPRVFLRKVPFPIPSRQVILPLSSPNVQTRVLYPSVQAIRYAYPWNGYLKAGPVPGKRVLFPQFSTLRLASPGSNSASSSSESSSESASSESSEEDKKEKKVEKARPSESEAKVKEPEKEPEIQSAEIEKEGEETSVEVQSKESIETAESQVSPQTAQNTAFVGPEDAKPYMFAFDHRDKNGTVQHRQEVSDVEGRVTGSYGYHADGLYRIANYVADSDGFRVNMESNEPGTVTHESPYANFISNKVTEKDKLQTENEESTAAVMNTDFQRDLDF